MQKKTRNFITLAFTVLIVAIMILYIGPNRFITNFALLKWDYASLFLIGCFITYFIRVLIWKKIFNSMDVDAKFQNLFYSSGLCVMFNEIIPFKVGDLIRLETTTKKENLPYGITLSSIALLRTLEFVFMVGVAFGSFIFLYLRGFDTGQFHLNQILILGIISVIILIGALVILGLKGEFIIKISKKLSNKLGDFIAKIVLPFKESLGKFSKDKKQLIKLSLLAFIAILIDSLLFNIILPSFNLHLNIAVVMIASLFMFLTTTIPLLPGGWGISDIIGATILLMFYPQYTIEFLLNIVLIEHFLRFIFAILYGSISIFKIDYKFKNLKSFRKFSVNKELNSEIKENEKELKEEMKENEKELKKDIKNKILNTI